MGKEREATCWLDCFPSDDARMGGGGHDMRISNGLRAKFGIYGVVT